MKSKDKDKLEEYKPKITPKPRFSAALTRVHIELLRPKGFDLIKYLSPGYGMYAFVRPRSIRLLEGIGVVSGLVPRAFRVELGVFPLDGRFFRGALFQKGRWRELGLRVSLGQILRPDDSTLTPEQRDFFSYRDQSTLVTQLRKAISQALDHGPSVWEQLEQALIAEA